MTDSILLNEVEDLLTAVRGLSRRNKRNELYLRNRKKFFLQIYHGSNACNFFGLKTSEHHQFILQQICVELIVCVEPNGSGGKSKSSC